MYRVLEVGLGSLDLVRFYLCFVHSFMFTGSCVAVSGVLLGILSYELLYSPRK